MSDINISVTELYAIIGQKEIINFNLKKDFATLKQKYDDLIRAHIKLQGELDAKDKAEPSADSN